MRNAGIYRCLTYLDKMHALNICKDTLFHLKNYAISTYMVFFDSNDDAFFSFFKRYVN